MNRIWANRLEAGTKTWSQVPADRKDGVNVVLLQDVKDGKLSSDKYTEITGNTYIAEEEAE